MPAISVIVPIYNAEKYMHQCIDSILNQTLTDFELILVDDGSPDNCGRICDEYAEKDSRIIVIHQENQGQSAARNHAIQIASGEWFHFVDSDDRLHPQMLEYLYRAVSENNVKLAYCDADFGSSPPDVFMSEKEFCKTSYGVDEAYLLDLFQYDTWGLWVIWAKLIHRDLVLPYPFEVGRIYEDSPVVCKWFSAVEQVVCVPLKLYFYYDNASGTMNASFSPKKTDRLWSINEQIKLFKRKKYFKMQQKFLHCYISRARELLRNSAGTSHEKYITDYVRNHMRHVYRKNRKSLRSSPRLRTKFLEIAFPRRLYLYWQFVGIRQSIKKCVFRK